MNGVRRHACSCCGWQHYELPGWRDIAAYEIGQHQRNVHEGRVTVYPDDRPRAGSQDILRGLFADPWAGA